MSLAIDILILIVLSMLILTDLFIILMVLSIAKLTLEIERGILEK